MLNAFEEKIRVKTFFDKSTVYFSWLIFGHNLDSSFVICFTKAELLFS
mgnify:CR=1 FL=1